MTTNSCAVETALARNLLSSVMALVLPCDLESENAALESFVTQQSALRKALERHNVFGLVTDGKALMKWQTRLLQLIEGPPVACRIGWELLLTTTRQSPLIRLESLAVKLLERVVKLLKQQQSMKREAVDTEEATATAACGVAQSLLLHVDRFNSDTRRDVLELLGKLMQPLVALLSSKWKTSKKNLIIAQFELVETLLCASPNSLRSYAAKIESACVGALFPAADGNYTDEVVAQKATVCLALLSNASDKPQQVWTQMAQKALEAAHQQLDSFAGKRSTVLSTDGVTVKKMWVHGGASQQLPIYQRAEVTLIRMTRALGALRELLSARTATRSRGQISEREAQQMLPDMVLFARRAMGVRAHEVGKHTGVSDDGVRLPTSVVYAMIPLVRVQTLRAVSALVERIGICALRHASQITRVFLLASENVGDGEDLQALADATAVCARRLGASTVENLGAPLLKELITRCKRILGGKFISTTISNNMAKASAAHQDDAKNVGNKSKKRKRQAAAAATIAALNGGNLSISQANFVSMRDESVIAQTLKVVLGAIAGCVSVYGSLLPEECRSLVRELALEAIQRRHVVGSSLAYGAVDPVALVLLSNAVTADATGSHSADLLCSIRYWQRRIVGCGEASSALQLVALNAGEAMLHPRAPPLTINFQQDTNNGHINNGRFGANLKIKQESTVLGDAMDWDKNECDESSGNEDAENEQEGEDETKKSKKAFTVFEKGKEEEGEEDKDDEDYEDARLQAATTEGPVEAVASIAMEEDEDEEDDDGEKAKQAAARAKSENDDKQLPVATRMANDDDDDDFPDIVVDDD
ncbi:hypothetical protein DD238_008204 [Peronospora effusa]|uniref:Pre-rRNA-processing protein RIX1 N-terminal domain-containing protein n=1 Tax=Peronospora effusa TaxID=542832 RepID=A0A3M6V6R8_9STRA|nr:hypothetical protein DD238_008204 [Peronospora effusa]